MSETEYIIKVKLRKEHINIIKILGIKSCYLNELEQQFHYTPIADLLHIGLINKNNHTEFVWLTEMGRTLYQQIKD